MVSIRLFKLRASVEVIGERPLSFPFPIVTIFWWDRKRVNATLTRRWEQLFATAASVPFSSERQWENRLIMQESVSTTDSEEVFTRGT